MVNAVVAVTEMRVLLFVLYVSILRWCNGDGKISMRVVQLVQALCLA